MRFSFWPYSSTEQVFTLQHIFEKSWCMRKTSTHVLPTSRKQHMTGYFVKSFGERCREYGINGRLILTAKSLYSSSEVCVRVCGVKSQPFTVGFPQGCVLSSLLFSLHELDRQ